ncbi:MAG: sugar-binding transcriptional regulator [Massilistercora timonensis]|uniref:sugar-binding transcriptional regulator n=1 Tax=Massilistercora timonensis TaxID=2086584 RepID=UPI002FA528C4
MKSINLSEEKLKEYQRVAYYYYKAGLTQEDIAKRMNMSRQRVNRIVSACVDLGIVKITIQNLDKSNLELETALEQKYNLTGVRIVNNIVEENIVRELGIAAGTYLQSVLKKGDIIGVTRGRTTAAMADHWTPSSPLPQDLTVTQLIGNARESDISTGVNGIVYRLAEKLGARESLMLAPVIVRSEALKRSILNDPFYQESYAIFKRCTVAVVGIGTAQSQWKHMISLYDRTDIEQSKWTKDVAGEVCTHFFNKDGEEVIPPFGDQIIAIPLEDYHNIPIRIGVAGGPGKTEAIRAALNGGYVNVLITDLQTANKLIK